MARGIRAIVLNMEEDFTVELRSKLLAVDGLKIVAELDEPALFETAITQFPAELLVVNLDPNPEELIQFGTQVAEKYPELTLFAISGSDNSQLILQAIRGGFREFLVRPIEEENLSDALKRIEKLSDTQQASGRLICVLGVTGGCGTTTTATNLACELSQMGKKSVALVDLDLLFGHVSTLLDLTPQFTMADLCHTLDSIDPGMIEKALIRHETGVHVLARPTHFLQAQQISLANLATVLNTLCGMFEYVVCDGPVRTDTVKPGLLDLADTTYVLLNMSVPAVRNVDRIIQELAREGYNLDRLQLIASRVSKDNDSLTIEDIEQTLNRKIVMTIPEEPKIITTAINTGQPLIRSAPKSKVREAIKTLALRLHDPKAVETKNSSSGGLFARVLGR